MTRASDFGRGRRKHATEAASSWAELSKPLEASQHRTKPHARVNGIAGKAKKTKVNNTDVMRGSSGASANEVASVFLATSDDNIPSAQIGGVSLYDEGQSCKWCQSVEHLATHCPKRQLDRQGKKLTLTVATPSTSADADDHFDLRRQQSKSSLKVKSNMGRVSGEVNKAAAIRQKKSKRKVVVF